MRVAQLAAMIAAEEGADPARAALLALWHDSQETRTGDLPHTATAYLTKPAPRRITADQTEHLPDRSREMVQGAVEEYEARHDGWIDSAREGLKTETGRRIAEAATSVSPLSWRDR
ncbi:HD domain-containing protein [Dactylosporangium sp. CA-233914]|uniref:HD domain-containing protein n=1 Tax=Dactylosporangium sp. CA-233914 TaxID=3239934 RepID=UPI003D939820